MKNFDLNNIFSESDCIPEQILFDYQDNKLSNKNKHIVEKHIANCEICSDALEGLALIHNRYKLKRSIKYINTAIDKHTFQKKPKTVTINMPIKLAIAATIAILIGISFLFTHYLRNYNDKIIAENNITKNNIQENILSPPSPNLDSENTKNKAPENKISSKKMVYKNTNIGESSEKEIINTYSIPVLVDQPVDKTVDNRLESVNSKAPVEFYKDLSKNMEENKTLPENKQVNEEIPGKPKIETDKLSGGMDVKDDEKLDNSGYIQENKKKEKISKIGDIINVKRSEGNIPTAPTSSQGNSVIANETFNYAIEKFNAKEYGNAKQLFEQILINDKSNYNALYFQALCCFNLDEYDNSISGFNKVLKFKNGEYFDSAKWYKALALIKKGNKKEAKKILDEIIKSNSPFKVNAEQKLKEI